MQATSTTKTAITRKFSIKRYLDSMTRGEARDARKVLSQRLGIQYHRFVTITNLRSDSHETIDSTKLKILAEFFSTTIDQLVEPYEDVGRND